MRDKLLKIFKQYHGDVDLIEILIDKLDIEWVETPRDLYEVVFGNATKSETRQAFRNIFQHGDEITIEYSIENLLRMMARGS